MILSFFFKLTWLELCFVAMIRRQVYWEGALYSKAIDHFKDFIPAEAGSKALPGPCEGLVVSQ